MNTPNIDRRQFLETIAATGALASSGLWLPSTAFAEETSMKIPVVKDMTANVLMDYIADKAGVNLGKHTTDDSRKLFTVEMGLKSPKTIFVGTNSNQVRLSDQLAWRTSEEGVKSYVHRQTVERGPSTIDYIFPVMDNLVFHLDRLQEQDKAKVVAAFPNGIKVSREELNAFAQRKYGAQIQAEKQAIAAMSISDDRKKKYDGFDALASTARLVTPGLSTGMYKEIAASGVTFGPNAKPLAAAESQVHRTENPGQIMAYLGISYVRKDGSLGNIGFSAQASDSPHLRYLGDLLAVEKAIGSANYSNAMGLKVEKRTPTTTPEQWKAAYTPINLEHAMALAENSQVIRAGHVSEDIQPKTYMNQRDYTFRRAGIQIVEPKKQA